MKVGDHDLAGCGFNEKAAKLFKQSWVLLQGALFAQPEVCEDPIEAAKFGQALRWEYACIARESPPFAGKFRQIAHLWHPVTIPEVQPIERRQDQVLDLN